MLDARGVRFCTSKRARRLGWFGVVLSLLANGALFAALAYVNERVEERATDITTNPIEFYVPPQEIEEAPPERDFEREPEPVEPEMKPLEPMETMTPVAPLLPRIPIENLSIDDAGAMQIAVSDLPVVVNAPQGPMEMPDVDQPPMRTSGTLPDYPRWAQSRALEADLTVEFVVGADGTVSDVRVSKLKGDERFRALAIEAVGKWRFRPGLYRGQNVSVRCFKHITFKLQD